MKRRFGKLRAALAIGCAMSMIASVGVFADEPTSGFVPENTDSINIDSYTSTTSINLIKNYKNLEAQGDNANSPAEIFTFTITPYGVWNAGDKNLGEPYTKSNMNLLGEIADVEGESGNTISLTETGDRKTVVTIKSEQGNSGNKLQQKLTLPDYSTVGDFWYKVVEENKKTTGVDYASNNDGNNTYYIHVQVVNKEVTNEQNKKEVKKVNLVTMHKTAPVIVDEHSTPTTKDYNRDYGNKEEEAQNNTKVQEIENTYKAGSLSVSKKVAGNAGDKERRFHFTVTFTKPENTIINSDITYTGSNAESDNPSAKTIYGQYKEGHTWKKGDSIANSEDTSSLTNTVELYIKHGETVKFDNIPYGVTYTVVEDSKYTEDSQGYTVTSVFSDSNKKIDTKSDTVQYINTKDTKIDIGVLLKNAPYIAMIVVVCAAGVVFVLRRRNAVED